MSPAMSGRSARDSTASTGPSSEDVTERVGSWMSMGSIYRFLSKTRLSHLRGDVFPGQAEDGDFLWGGRLGVFVAILGGDDDATELGEHVEDRGLGLLPVPRGQLSRRCDVVGVVSGGGIPADSEGVYGERERDGAFDGGAQSVAGLADAADLLGVFDRDLDGPARGIPLDYLRGASGQVGGDQRHVVAVFDLSRTR